jgi:drug/metabolite transporter (DMT)-like permease
LKSQLKLLLLGLVVWVSISSASILVLLSGAPAEACAFWRLAISALILNAMWTYRNKRVNLNLSRVKWYHVLAGLSLALHFILWMRSLFIISVYISTLLVTLYPLYSLLGEVLFLQYKPPRLQVLGLIFSTLLLTLYLNIEGLVLNEGALLALLGGVVAAVYFEVGGYARKQVREDVVTYASFTYVLSAIFILTYALISGVELFNYPPKTYFYFTLLALVPMIFGHTVMNYVLARYPASLVTMIALGEPFGAGLLAYLVLGQGIGASHLFYGAVIITTVFTTLTVASRGLGESSR